MNLLLLREKIKSHFPISPVSENVDGLPTAAVMVTLFSRSDETFVLMIKRARHLERHAGEIAFPGGMFDPDADKDLLDTALRETLEELRLTLATGAVAGRLTPVTTATGVNVTPFVAWVPDLPRYDVNVGEVELALEIPLNPLLASRRQSPDPRHGGDVFFFKEHCVWGASAKILYQVEQLANLGNLSA